MPQMLARLAGSRPFRTSVLGTIVLAGLVIGLETSPEIMARWGGWLHLFDKAVLAVFTIEALVKIGAEGRRPWRYFRDPWNIFDFAIVVAGYIPAAGPHTAILRLVRLLRVLRLVRALPRLRLLVEALLHGLPSMGYVTLLLMLFLYIYAVAGVFLFGANDPLHFGDLREAALSLFAVVTLEGWVDLMNIQRFGCDVAGLQGFEQLCRAPAAHPVAAPVYFVSFILLGTMIILNLVIGVIVNSVEEANKSIEEEERKAVESLAAPVRQVAGMQQAMEAELLQLSRHVEEALGRIRQEIDRGVPAWKEPGPE